jgi:hypothetical protein
VPRAARIDPRIATAARVSVVPVAELREWDRNPHRGDVSTIAASLLRFGQVVPIVRAPDGWIVAGNHTLRAITDLGWEKCAVVTLDGDEAELFAYGLASNRIGLLGDDDDRTVLELLNLVELDGTGYTLDDVDDLTALLQEMTRTESSVAEALVGRCTIDPTTGIAPNELSYPDALGLYQVKQVRTVLFDYLPDTFEWLMGLLGGLREQYAVESNAALFVALVAEAANVAAPVA